jgi:hypothetical protein
MNSFGGVKPLPPIMGLLPLIVFAAMSGRVAEKGATWAAVAALGVLVVLLIAPTRRIERLHKRVPSLDVIVGGLLAAVAVAGFVGGHRVDQWLFEWGSGCVLLVAGALILVTAPIFPFTEPYARANTPRAYWCAPTFRQINRVLSGAWGAAVAAIGGGGILVAALDGRAASTDSMHVPDLVLNWLVPIAISSFMIEFTIAYPNRVIGATR